MTAYVLCCHGERFVTTYEGERFVTTYEGERFVTAYVLDTEIDKATPLGVTKGDCFRAEAPPASPCMQSDTDTVHFSSRLDHARTHTHTHTSKTSRTTDWSKPSSNARISASSLVTSPLPTLINTGGLWAGLRAAQWLQAS